MRSITRFCVTRSGRNAVLTLLSFLYSFRRHPFQPTNAKGGTATPPLRFVKIHTPNTPISPMLKTTEPKRKQPSLKALLRSVASSTAVETGQSVAQIEQKLQRPTQRFAHIKLAR
jgi:hypothetical protein